MNSAGCMGGGHFSRESCKHNFECKNVRSIELCCYKNVVVISLFFNKLSGVSKRLYRFCS